MRVLRLDYVLTGADLAGFEPSDIHDIKIEDAQAGVVVTITSYRDRKLVVSIDPIGRDFVSRLDVKEFSVNDAQVRLVVTGDKSAFAPPSLQD